MKPGEMGRAAQTALVVVGLTFQAAPIAWAQLETVDPMLNAAVEALVTTDPEVVGDPELATLCRDIAEATVLDPRERAAITREVIELHRAGVDLSTIVSPEVREAAREQFAQVQGQMRERLETLRATDPEKAREIELMMREGERQMAAFESGERYVPSQEMVAHAETMMREWESEMIAQGAPPEFVERARQEFAMWSGGEMEGMMGGPGHEMGPGPGGMPSVEQMEQMVAAGQMTPEQLQMAKEYMQGGFESYQTGMEAYHTGMESYQAGMEAYQAGMEYGQMMEQQYMEQYAAEYNFTPPENMNYDNLQQQQFDQFQPPPGGEVLVATHDHDLDIVPDEYHYDVNADGIADHAHPTPH